MATKTKTIDPLSEECMGAVTEVGQQAVWSLSSCKPGAFYVLAAFIYSHATPDNKIFNRLFIILLKKNRIRRGTATGQLHGHILAIRWPTTAFG